MKQTRKARTAVPAGLAGPLFDSQLVRKRSVTIAGHRTSVSVEEAFWGLLRGIAAARGQSISELVTEIDRERSGNLSSAIRVFVLREVAAGFDPDAPAF